MASFPYQLIDVAEGLRYLHHREVIHGDLKGVGFPLSLAFCVLFTGTLQPNILVDGSGRARITDFGLSRSQETTFQTTVSYGHTARWTAPEILGGSGTASKEGDVFAFAMVMVEVPCQKLYTPTTD